MTEQDIKHELRIAAAEHCMVVLDALIERLTEGRTKPATDEVINMLVKEGNTLILGYERSKDL